MTDIAVVGEARAVESLTRMAVSSHPGRRLLASRHPLHPHLDESVHVQSALLARP